MEIFRLLVSSDAVFTSVPLMWKTSVYKEAELLWLNLGVGVWAMLLPHDIPTWWPPGAMGSKGPEPVDLVKSLCR